MFDLKITKLKEKCDKKALEAMLRKLPGLTANQISMGLRYQPFKVLTINGEEQARALKNSLEKLGAVCVIEKAKAASFGRGIEAVKITGIPDKEEEKKFQWRFLLAIVGILVFFLAATIYFSHAKSAPKTQRAPLKQIPVATGPPLPKQVQEQELASRRKDAARSAKSRATLKHELASNSYDTEAWKALADNLEEQGDTAAARVARASYEKSVRTQQVLASLAKTFGNNVRVEITAATVYYRTSKDLTEAQFYLEAEKLRDSLSAKFPGQRSLVIENYTSDNKVQRTILEPNYVPEKTSAPRDKFFY
ncbi:MAG: hypothetical protein FWC15_08665 [Fibromonadales bacterium]|nr:hypothetical protein [Fibromonadales bacterium]